jgi:hypothetical protein
MFSTQHLLVAAKYLVARDGAPAALNFASKGLQAMIDAGHEALIPDWQALHSLVQDAAMGLLPRRTPTLH